MDGGGGAAGGRKPDHVAMRSVHKKHTLFFNNHCFIDHNKQLKSMTNDDCLYRIPAVFAAEYKA